MEHKNFPEKFEEEIQSNRPGLECTMKVKPIFENAHYKSSDKLLNKVALITGGDSGIGRAVSILYAKEGADIIICYLNEHDDANETKKIVESHGRKCVLIPFDIRNEKCCFEAVDNSMKEFKNIDILVNNAGEQTAMNSIEDITYEQLLRTFETNIFSMFFMVKASLKYMKEGSVIINTSSITAYEGSETLIDYSSTKGAITSFTRSLSLSLIKRNIRVNAIAPGPTWTPLIPSSFSKEKTLNFGSDTEYKRAAQPVELAGTYLFLASDESYFINGETIHVNGGRFITS